MPISRIGSNDFPINTIITKIESGEIKLPPFQRRFVWNEEQVIDLLDSIYKEYPIGCIIVWRSTATIASRRNIGGFKLPDREVKFPIDYILDGQQRLTSIYALFCKDRTLFDASTDEQYCVDPQLFDIYFDLEDKKFIPTKDMIAGHDNLKMSALFNTAGLFEVIKPFSEPHKTEALELLQKFSNYNIPFIITEREQDDIGIIFERINNTGTSLSPINLMVAWTWNGDFHLQDEFNDILEYLGEKGFEYIPEKILLQCLGVFINKSAKTKDVLKLEADKVRGNIGLLRVSLENAIDFLATQLKMVSIDFLPHTHQIVPIVYFYAKLISPINAEQINALKKWFWRTSFSNRYSDSTDDKINEDLVFMDKVLSADYSGVTKYSLTVDQSFLLKQKFSKGNPYTRAFLLLLGKLSPKDLTNGADIDLDIALSTYNRKEYHHIFPKNYLVKNRTTPESINLLCNFTFLPSNSNKVILSQAPSDYFFNIIPQKDWDSILESNLIPLEKTIYKQNNYQAFLEARAQKIMQCINTII